MCIVCATPSSGGKSRDGAKAIQQTAGYIFVRRTSNTLGRLSTENSARMHRFVPARVPVDRSWTNMAHLEPCHMRMHYQTSALFYLGVKPQTQLCI